MCICGADAERPLLGTDVTGIASREFNPGQILVGSLVGVKRSDGRVTVARLEPPLPSTSPGFFHVTLDSSGSYKDVPMDQLYSLHCVDPHNSCTADSRAQRVAPVVGTIPCLLCFFWFCYLVLDAISIFSFLQMIGRTTPPSQPIIAQIEGVATKQVTQIDRHLYLLVLTDATPF